MEQLNQKILDCLEQGQAFAVITIMTHKGSTPRTSGSKMIVLKDRTIFGTIGGGLVEAMVIDAGVELLELNKCKIMEFALNKKLKDGLDMVCGGDLTVLMEAYVKSPELISVFQALVALEKKGKKGFLVSKIKGFSKSDFTTQKCLALPDTSVKGSMVLPVQLMEAIQEDRFSGSFPVLYNAGLEEFIVEPVLPLDVIYIFGAGHVGFQLAKMAMLADFQTIIVDDRGEFANLERFPDSKEVHAVDHFKKAFDDLNIDTNAYLVIMTRGHLHDQTVLEQALKTSAAYVGMIGSSSKRKQIYDNLMEKGVSKKSLEKVYSPIGLEIMSETPAEIAVSIIGEIILVRASGAKNPDPAIIS